MPLLRCRQRQQLPERDRAIEQTGGRARLDGDAIGLRHDGVGLGSEGRIVLDTHEGNRIRFGIVLARPAYRELRILLRQLIEVLRGLGGTCAARVHQHRGRVDTECTGSRAEFARHGDHQWALRRGLGYRGTFAAARRAGRAAARTIP